MQKSTLRSSRITSALAGIVRHMRPWGGPGHGSARERGEYHTNVKGFSESSATGRRWRSVASPVSNDRVEGFHSLDQAAVTRVEGFHSLDQAAVTRAEGFHPIDQAAVTRAEGFHPIDQAAVTRASLDQTAVTRAEGFHSLDGTLPIRAEGFHPATGPVPDVELRPRVRRHVRENYPAESLYPALIGSPARLSGGGEGMREVGSPARLSGGGEARPGARQSGAAFSSGRTRSEPTTFGLPVRGRVRSEPAKSGNGEIGEPDGEFSTFRMGAT
jgi:hypothetical protein